jgi:hypothetical protein
MASIYNYTFDNSSRLGEDACYLNERTKQNTHYGNYNLTNYFGENCGNGRPMEIATSQPNIFIKDGYGPSGPGGCNVDKDSNLRIGSIQTNPKSRISLMTRPFTTVPYLGRGAARPMEEAQLQQGEFVTSRKSMNTTSEISYIDYKNYPLLPSLQQSITNPNNLIEGVASEGWIRGGLPSRDLVKDQDYIQKQL